MKKEDINNAIASLTLQNIDKELKNYIKRNNDLLQKVKKENLELIKKNRISIYAN